MRKPLIAGNWKMYKTIPETEQFIQKFLSLLPEDMDRDVVLCVPFTGLSTLHHYLKENSLVDFGAQNVYWEPQGAFTGEISAPMLKDAGCTYVIVGHSERRALFGETDAMVCKKIQALWKENLHPICCVGETLEEREQGRAEIIISEQLTKSLENLDASHHDITIAYEPVWAIGTGVNASERDAQEMAQFIRKKLGQLFNDDIAQRTRILYGGSVKPASIDALMCQKDIDGVLVGGASLNPEDFARIVRFQK